ncbi:nucleotidyl transferase AbiEii/AbiGii toxin family protein [Hyalangium rubrum]|uniref:Nucleotidyl transferase AbiEii/AbiGii toxin family protein n=1 Tax=Hyalangium rubrum TaxID=3103134 RepID=A0ABU5HGH8_9BACT|nr:nucleotidyl transferase AbiEii/AbiGii toxin family protein [Hyalangium sp. s54d21]MDY7232565.1 nucleotidyl transferase AbiEii/AbiGii toxin family protein [Hyalangium sp. s54d21]
MNPTPPVLAAAMGLLRRLARSPVAEELILRGGMMMRLWSGSVPRPVEDIDFLARFPFDAAATVARLESLCRVEVEDGMRFGALRSEVIWAETAFPGMRVFVEVALRDTEQPLELRIDTGFGDPMDPPAMWMDHPLEEGTAARVLACRPETLFAWKVHGLFERGPGRFRPKDLFDVYLLARHAPLDAALLPRALRLAFDSRGDSLELTSRLVAGEFGQSPWSLEKWARFRNSLPEGRPEQLSEVVTSVARVLGPVVTVAMALPSRME